MADTLLPEALVGLLPAAGTARRISPLPCSKEILPVGYFPASKRQKGGAKASIHYLLEQMRAAGGERIYIVISPQKWDLPAFLKDGADVAVDLAYLVTRESWGVPFTLDRAFAYIKMATVLFGFPDILIDQPGAYEALLDRLQREGEDLVLGVFPANSPAQEDLVTLDDGGRVCGLEIKMTESDLTLAWMLAAWRPRFSYFIREWTDRWRQKLTETGTPPTEPYLGDVIEAAIRTGMKVGAVTFDQGAYLDIGTPDNLAKAPQFAAGLETGAV